MERRIPAHRVTPWYEDSGIFKQPVKQYEVSLVPTFARNRRDDIVVKGFIEGTRAIDVVFAGRRKTEATPALEMLKTLWSRENIKARKTGDHPERDNVRLRVRVEGCWRTRHVRDDQGWQTSDHQLFAARWIFSDGQGTARSFGALPIHLQKGPVEQPRQD